MPERVPSAQVRCCEEQVEPLGTQEDSYPVTVVPSGTTSSSSAQFRTHDEYVYVPESVPFVHVRCCDTHDEPAGTEDDWCAVTPLKLQPVEHDACGYVPESVPFVHVRVSETDEQVEPYGTVRDWYAVIDAPLSMVVPSKVQVGGGLTVHEEYAYEPEREPL